MGWKSKRERESGDEDCDSAYDQTQLAAVSPEDNYQGVTLVSGMSTTPCAMAFSSLNSRKGDTSSLYLPDHDRPP
jgi:hypothetical protein